MDLFLAIHIHDDPLFLAGELEQTVTANLIGVTYFQVDNFTSPELARTATEAIRKADRVLLYLETVNPEANKGSIGSILQRAVRKGDKICWIEKGSNDLHVLRRMIKRSYSVEVIDDTIKLAKDFFL